MSIHSLRETLRADLNASTERGRLIRSAGLTAGLKLSATVLAFGASLLYARVLGPHGYGLYAYVVAWTAVFTIPVGLGLPQYLVREGAKSQRSLSWLRHWADKRISVVGLLAAFLLSCAFFVPSAAGSRWLFLVAAPLPLLNNLTYVRGALLQAQGWIARSQWPTLLLGPLVMLASLIALWQWQGRLYPIEVMAALTSATVLQLFINHLQLGKAAAAALAAKHVPVQLRQALPFMLLSGLYLLNNRVDLLMLGTLKGAHDAGVYAVAARAAELVTFFLTAAVMAIGPRIARIYQQGDNALLQRLISGTSRRVLLATGPLALVLIAAAHPLLTYLYGPQYKDGAVALQILAAAQLVNVAAGPTGTILNMTGHERLSAIGVACSVCLNILMCALLIPAYGVKGAAIATALSIVAWNIILWHWTRRRLNLHSTGIGF